MCSCRCILAQRSNRIFPYGSDLFPHPAVAGAYHETQQGNVAPNSLIINTIGPPCPTETAWHGCEPVMTIVPNFFVSGVPAMIVSLLVLVWAAAFAYDTQRRADVQHASA